MAQFEKREFPDNQTAYEITDNWGHTAQLTTEQARELLQWLYAELEEAEETTARLPTLPE